MPHVPDVVLRLAEACRGAGSAAALEALLHAEAVALCDAGGEVPAALQPACGEVSAALQPARGAGGEVLAALQPACGAAIVARLVVALLCDRPGTVLSVESVNGRAGLALRRDGTTLAVIAVGTEADRITALWIVLNPAKLHPWHRR